MQEALDRHDLLARCPRKDKQIVALLQDTLGDHSHVMLAPPLIAETTYLSACVDNPATVIDATLKR